MKCEAITQTGEPCRMQATASGLCFTHDPALAEARKAARRLGGQNRRRHKVSGTPEDVHLQSVEDAISVLELALGDTLAQENSYRRSRTLGYLANSALRAIEMRSLAEIESRLTALERAAA